MGGDWEGLASFSVLEMPAQALTLHSRSPFPKFPLVSASWAGSRVEDDEWEQEVSGRGERLRS